MTAPADRVDLALLRKRDEGEFTRFVRRYEEFVLGLCQSLGLGAADREDAAAETFVIAYRGLEGFRGEAELSTWLYRIAYRTALKVRRRYPIGVPLGEIDAADVRAEKPFEGLANEEECRAVWEGVRQLEPEQAAAVELFYRRGMSVEEVAGVMEKPVGTVKTLLFRGRERLRFLLKGLAPVEQQA